MKKQLKSLLLVAIFACTTLPAWGQASTQGKEFWVSSTIVCSPNSATAAPYIAVSAEKECTVTITGGVGNAINITQPVKAGSWNEFGNSNKSYNNTKPFYNTDTTSNAGPINVKMDATKWYPVSMNNASNVRTLAGQKNMYGLHITATEDISVYVILSSTNSMDASNILPVSALGSEYYTQDYWPIVKSGFSNVVTVTTILATEDDTTKVDIIPNGNTYDGHQSGALYTVALVKGQTYYLMSEADKQLTGTHIQAKNDKKIAIYCGVPLTNLPTNIAARDCLFEQPMPVNYWGTQFIVTRSLEKNGNLIGITASQRGTEIKIDGYSQAIINEGETYYVMLQSSNDPNGRDPGTKPADLVVTADDAYIETSCPCAVYNYDTGNSYRGQSGDEIINSQGDPSSVWVSPIQQRIGKITFGTCYTEKTKDHFLNVVTERATCQSTKLFALSGTLEKDTSDIFVWTPVSGNPNYSYARVKLSDIKIRTKDKNGNPIDVDVSVFRLENERGFIANIYGNGNDESYAYSAGSAAVEQGVYVNGEPFTNGYRSDKKYCFGDEITFNANVGTDEITRVDWTFGDGTTDYYGPSVVSHTYTAPGWYDVTAALWGHQACSNEDNIELGTVNFSFRIVRPDTVFGEVLPRCILLEDYKADPTRWDDSIAHPRIDTVQENCYDTVKLNYIIYNKETEEFRDTIVGRDIAYGYDGTPYYASQDVVEEYTNAAGCPHFVRYYVKVITCLDIRVENNPAAQHVCADDENKSFDVTYYKFKGDIDGKAILKIPGYADKMIDISNENVPYGAMLTIPLENISRPGIYHAQLIINDLFCDTKTFDIDFTVYYPSSVINYLYNNVLAVYAKGYGGNIYSNFTGFQWYLNGIPIPGATSSVYHTDAPFKTGERYSVVLSEGQTAPIPSCELTITSVENYNANQAPAAEKKLINRHIYIVIDDRMYDAYGQRVK